MIKLDSQNNYLLKAVNYSCPDKIKKIINNPFQLIKINGCAFVFTDGKSTFTLWSNHRYRGNFECFITPEKNKNYRITKYQLNSNSIYLWIKVKLLPLKFRYFQSCSFLITLQKYIWFIEFYNKINVKKNLNRVVCISKVFQNENLVRFISEFM